MSFILKEYNNNTNNEINDLKQKLAKLEADINGKEIRFIHSKKEYNIKIEDFHIKFFDRIKSIFPQGLDFLDMFKCFIFKHYETNEALFKDLVAKGGRSKKRRRRKTRKRYKMPRRGRTKRKTRERKYFKERVARSS